MQSKTKISGHPLIKAILICLGFAFLYLLIADSSTLWDRDEPRYARVTVEMIESGNYLVPTFNGEAWADKPILLYWLMSILVRLLGPGEAACRFPAIIGTAITLLLTFFIGRKLFSVKAGLWAEVILATTLLMMFVGSSAIVDGVMLPFIVGIMAVFVRRIHPGGQVGCKIHFSDFLIAGLLMGFGMLAKGPIGLLPVPVMAVVLWFGRSSGKELIVNLAGLALAVIIAIGIFLVWAIPADKAMGGELLRVFFGHHVFARALKPMESHGGHFLSYLPYYPAIIIAGFFPWSVFLPGSLSAIIGKRIGIAGARNILLSWIAVPVILMTLAATKLPHYILFVWPAIAVMAGGILAAGEGIFNERDRKWLRGGIWFLIPVGLGLASGFVAAGYVLKTDALKLPGLICGMVLIVTLLICCRLQVREKFIVSAGVILAGIFVLMAPLLFGLLPAIEEIKISPPLAKAVREKTGADVPAAMYKYAEPTLNFYIGRKIETLRNDEAVAAWTRQPNPGVLIIPKDVLADIRQRFGPLPLEQIASKNGFNYSKGKQLEVLALIRKTENQ